MPRKPRRSGQLAPRSFGFSPFARSVTRAATLCSSKHKVSNFHTASSSKTLVDRTSKHSLSDSDLESESFGEETPEEVIQADFAFFDPKSNDFHGVKVLLQTYLDDKEWDLSGFVDLILAQTTVGTVVKIEDDEEEAVFALVTALNLGRYKSNKCVTEVKDYLLQVCEKSLTCELKGLLEDQAAYVGLVVSQRVMNLPPQLLPHLYDALFDEISWATEDEPMEDLRNSFRFKHYLMVTRIYKKINQHKKGSTTGGNNDDIIYLKPEDELFYELCSLSFTFTLHLQPPAPQELRNYRLMGLVMVVEADKVPAFRQRLQSLVDNS